MKGQRSFSGSELTLIVCMALACGEAEDRSPWPAHEPAENDSLEQDALPQASDALGCRGLAEACRVLPEIECANAIGCVVDRHCEGSSRSCGLFEDRFACGRQRGCEWSATNCAGSASECASFETTFTCHKQLGCVWTDACDGLAASCTALDSEHCARQPGCRWTITSHATTENL